MTSNCCRDKAVVVVVYTEKQGGRRHCHRKVDGGVRGYNRRAELLDYTRHLREPAPQSHPPSQTKLPTAQASTADGVRRQNHSTPLTCFAKWSSFVATRFLRSLTALKTTKDKDKKKHKSNVSSATKMKALVKSLQIKKRGSFVSKMLAALQKRR